MSLQDFQYRWKRIKECASSIGPHIEHYKAATQNDELASLFHLKSKNSIGWRICANTVSKGIRWDDYEKKLIQQAFTNYAPSSSSIPK